MTESYRSRAKFAAQGGRGRPRMGVPKACLGCGRYFYVSPSVRQPYCTQACAKDHGGLGTREPYTHERWLTGTTVKAVVAVLDEGEPITLEGIGRRIGRTRQRIWQICVKLDRFPDFPYMHHCDICGAQRPIVGRCEACVPKAPRVTLECCVCGKGIERRVSEDRNRARRATDGTGSGRIFCSRFCQGQWIGVNSGFTGQTKRDGFVTLASVARLLGSPYASVVYHAKTGKVAVEQDFKAHVNGLRIVANAEAERYIEWYKARQQPAERVPQAGATGTES